MHDQMSELDLLPDSRIEQLGHSLHDRIGERRVVRKRRHRAVAAGVLLLVVGGGTTAGTIMAWPTNEHGQSYGPADGRLEDPTDGSVVEPDLTLAVGWDGERRVVGYVLSTDLNPEFANPGEVLAWLEEHPTTEDREVPLYDEHMNVIGTFTIQGYDTPPPGTIGAP